MPIGVSAVSPVFADRVARLLELAEGISQPRATVMCTDCQVELL
jgi:hypothetical protein